MAQVATNVRSGGFGSTLRNAQFRKLWLAQLLSQTFQNAANFGALIISAKSGSVTAVGGVFISFSLPVVLFGGPAGVLVDRLNKRAVLWVSNLARAIVSLGFVVSLLISPTSYLPIYILTFIVSVIGQFFGPAEGAAIPLLVKREELIPALSLFNITFTLSQALGFILIGPLIINLSPTLSFGALVLNPTMVLFIIIALMYGVCALLTSSIPPEKLRVAKKRRKDPSTRGLYSVWRDVYEAGNFVRKDTRLFFSLFQLTLSGIIVSVLGVMAPQLSTVFMHRDYRVATLIIFLPAGVGLVAGSALMPRVVARIGLVVAEVVGIALVSGSLILLTIIHWFASTIDPVHSYTSSLYTVVIVSLTALIGMSLSLVGIPAQTVMQHRSPDWIKGRVLSLQSILQNSALIPVIPLVGIIADSYGPAVALNALAALVIVIGFGSVYLTEGRGTGRGTPSGENLSISSTPNKPLITNPQESPAQAVRYQPSEASVSHTGQPE